MMADAENHRIVKALAPDDTVDGVLNDGTRVLFRPIRPNDKDVLRRGLENMSPESRYRRFFAPIDHFSDEQLAYLTEIDYQDHFAWLAFLPDLPGSPASAWHAGSATPRTPRRPKPQSPLSTSGRAGALAATCWWF